MKFDYTAPEMEITLFATEIIMDSSVSGIEEVAGDPAEIDANIFLD